MKRKHEDEAGEDIETQQDAKRRRSDDAAEEQSDFMPLDGDGEDADAGDSGIEQAFFGMLDESEQEYFKHADELLEVENFDSPEERSALVEQIHREADGKELKIAQSQSCSRLMERLIQLSCASQLKKLFQKFSGK